MNMPNNNIEIIENEGELKRKVWNFSVSIDYGRCCIYFDSYIVYTRRTKRCNWIKTHDEPRWVRTDHRDNNIPCPEIPVNIKQELEQRLIDLVSELPIIK
jgi:hypothetical protein